MARLGVPAGSGILSSEWGLLLPAGAIQLIQLVHERGREWNGECSSICVNLCVSVSTRSGQADPDAMLVGHCSGAIWEM